ncbi:MAG: hypothetical protein F4Z28_04205 [Gammaproteobacteria bacterium]|nr:hypothetical protein [Gammaproteobacteria bacterium]
MGRLATDYVGGELRVDYEVGDLSEETPMARELRLAKESRERAETELMKDPNVRALVEEFGGSLDNARLLGDDGAREGSPP